MYENYEHAQLWTVDASVTWNLVCSVFGPIRPNPIVVIVRETKYASKFGPGQKC